MGAHARQLVTAAMALLLLACFFLPIGTASAQDADPQYALVVNAGSTATRATLFHLLPGRQAHREWRSAAGGFTTAADRLKHRLPPLATAASGTRWGAC